MTVLEIIHLRLAQQPLKPLIDEINCSIKAAGDQFEFATIYCLSGPDTDLAIHIHHPRESQRSAPSALGLHLKSSLRAFGLVEHTMWEAME